MVSPYAKPIPSANIHAARYHPGAVNRLRGCGGAPAAWACSVAPCGCATAIGGSSSLRHLRQILHQGIDLLLRQGTAEVAGHHVRRVTLGDHGVGGDDRLPDERGVLA